MFLYKPSAKTGKAYKFTRPFFGPYRIVELTPNDAKIRPIDKPSEEPIFVALDRLRRCPEEVPDEFWPTRAGKKTSPPKTESTTTAKQTPTQEVAEKDTSKSGVWSGRLRSRKQADAIDTGENAFA